MSRLSTKNYKPRATGSLRHLMLKVLARHTITAPYRLNYSMLFFVTCLTNNKNSGFELVIYNRASEHN